MIQREIEQAGVATVSLSLLREFSEKVRPPRALWVPFPFGRPLGAPGEPAIQRRTLAAALQLLERSDGPVLEELTLSPDEEHLDARWQMPGQTCGPRGCSLDAIAASSEPATYSGEFERVDDEVVALAPGHRRYREAKGGRTQVGSSGVTPDRIGDAARVIHAFVTGGPSHRPPGAPDVAPRLLVRLSIDDVKAYYLEAKIGASPEASAENAAAANDWFWLETEAGRLIVAARDRLVETTDRRDDPNWIMARGIVPRGYGSTGYGLDHVTGAGPRSPLEDSS